MRHPDYVPLHLHTEYSLLDGAIKIKELMAVAKGMGIDSVAITDHGNLFGAVEFYKEAHSSGIKPIIGCEVYLAPKSRFDKSKSEEESAFHLILLAKDSQGYRNLISLVSKAYTEGFYYKPRIDIELLSSHSEGLICLTSCMKGEVPYYLLNSSEDKAMASAQRYMDIFGKENFFIEIQENEVPEQLNLNRKLLDLAKKIDAPIVATNDCHYISRQDARVHEILLCIQTGKTINESKRMKFSSDGFYFKSPQEFSEAFKDLPEAVLNTKEIAQRCNVEMSLKGFHLPRFTPPEGYTSYEYLRSLVYEGLKMKKGSPIPQSYVERAEYELSIIKKMGYESYFLIVWDLISYARRSSIPVGPGRGSAAGSLVAYSLGITELDPLRYGLIFERFLNPERISMPDIDIDFCKEKRPQVIAYVAERYGSDHVAQIITFGTMAARAAIRDVARAVDFPYAEADRLAKLVPEGPKITLNDALALEPALKELYDTDKRVKEIIDVARRLEGIARHASTHAAGIVISPEPLTEKVPLYRNPQDGTITTQFDMGSVESLGLVKFDLLGLKTLTMIDKTIRYIKSRGESFSIEEIPLDDKKTYSLLSSGSTTGVFQLESTGMRAILTKMQPQKFEDLIALVALYRPGPIGSGMVEDFIKRMKGQVPVEYLIPELKDILDETYGVMLYQEQVMSIANKIANFSMSEADNLRKAMGKKLPEVMAKFKEAFIEGAQSNGVPKKKAEELFDLIKEFAGYGFNKSHSAAYALIAYRTAYLKAHYPVEFMAATLSADLDNTDKIVKSIKECRTMGIEILPPDINKCGVEFTIDNNAIRFGLGAVKGVGVQAVEAILEARNSGGNFKSISDFLRRLESKKVNKKVVEALIKAGAFDSVLGAGKDISTIAKKRAEALLEINSEKDSSSSLGLFGEQKEQTPAPDESQLLRDEKEAIGFYITSHPIAKYRDRLSEMNISSTQGLEAVADGLEVELAGVITEIKKLRTKGKSELMAYITLEDEEGSIEAIVFPDLLKNRSGLVKKDIPVVISGNVERTENGVRLISKDIFSVEEKIRYNSNGKKVEITIVAEAGTSPEFLKDLRGAVHLGSGKTPLYIKIKFKDTSYEAVIKAQDGVRPDTRFISKVEEIIGKGSVRII